MPYEILLQHASIISCLCVFGISHFGLYYLYSSTIERRAIIGWESGTNAPSVRNLVKLSDALDCGIDYFLGAIDYMDISPISLSAHFSGISPDIINYGLENPDYLECLNFFMHPDNCKTLFNNVTISAWRKYWINAGLPKIKEPFKSEVYKAYDEYSAITPGPMSRFSTS